MLDRSKTEAASPRSRAIAFAVAACLALAIGGVLAYTGMGYITDGCGCYDPVRDEVVGGVLLGVAAATSLAGLLLAMRALRVVRLRADS
jgi:hypothetical protein